MSKHHADQSFGSHGLGMFVESEVPFDPRERERGGVTGVIALTI